MEFVPDEVFNYDEQHGIWISPVGFCRFKSYQSDVLPLLPDQQDYFPSLEHDSRMNGVGHTNASAPIPRSAGRHKHQSLMGIQPGSSPIR